MLLLLLLISYAGILRTLGSGEYGDRGGGGVEEGGPASAVLLVIWLLVVVVVSPTNSTVEPNRRFLPRGLIVGLDTQLVSLVVYDTSSSSKGGGIAKVVVVDPGAGEEGY